MSVYTDLLKAGVADESARQLADVVTEGGPVTRQYLDLKLAEFESRFNQRLQNTLIALTGIYAGLLAAMAGVIVWAIERTLAR